MVLFCDEGKQRRILVSFGENDFRMFSSTKGLYWFNVREKNNLLILINGIWYSLDLKENGAHPFSFAVYGDLDLTSTNSFWDNCVRANAPERLAI